MGFYGRSFFEVQDYFSKLQAGSTIDYVKDEEWGAKLSIADIGPHATLRILGNGAWDFSAEDERKLGDKIKDYTPLADDWISIWIAPTEAEIKHDNGTIEKKEFNNIDGSLIPTVYIAHDAPKFYEESNGVDKIQGYYVQGDKAIVRATPYYSAFKPIFAEEDENETNLQFNQTISIPSFPIDLKGHICFDKITYTEYKLPILTWQEYTG